jgi:energy-coupling factor transporter transmembrane protein EcfT
MRQLDSVWLPFCFKVQKMPNPAVLILAWVTLVIALQMMEPAMLSASFMLLLVSALVFPASRLLSLMRRSRWIMFSLLLIYAYTTQGTPVFVQMAAFSPTSEGLQQGLLQLARLISVLASLSILLSLMDQQKLVSGLYTLAYPLHFIGLSRERIAVRLALTLQYAETAMRDTSADWRGSIEHMLAPASVEQSGIELPVVRFTWLDSLLLAAGCALLVLVLL